MEFGFSEEQEQLKRQVRRFLDSECPLSRVRELMEAEPAYDAQLWRRMAELGWQALTVPIEQDGLGLAWEDLVVVAEEMGRSLCPSPFLANAVATRLLASLGSEEQKSRWLAAIASGELIATLALLEENDVLDEQGVELEARPAAGGLSLSGVKMFVPYGQAAGLLLVAARENGGVSLFAVPADAQGLKITPLKLIDATYRAARVELRDVAVGKGDRLGAKGGVWSQIERAVDAARAALAAEMVGAADAAVRMAADYAKVRKQFGQPIGRFQGVKHKLAELHVAVESARSLVYYASWAVDNKDDASAHVSMAKAWASEALDRAGEECIQIHGAIGFTWECDAQLYYKRARYCRNLLGSPEYHQERLLVARGL